jgi:hypothetical protein
MFEEYEGSNPVFINSKFSEKASQPLPLPSALFRGWGNSGSIFP